MIKSKYITHIILEGPDGVGKTTIKDNIWRKYKFKYRVYDRGEISDYVYAKKYNRKFVSTQRGLPFLYIILLKSPEEIKNQIINRDGINSEDLDKNDTHLFIDAYNTLCYDYHIIAVDISNLTVEEACNKVYNASMSYISLLESDDEINSFNEMYQKGCNKLNLKWICRNNQPFIKYNDDIEEMVMADAQLHNGNYETYSDLSLPHNLIFSYGYTMTKLNTENELYDFAYPINSKILSRPEIYDYIDVITKNHTLLTTDSKYIPDKYNIIKMPKIFGDDYINEISKANATVYCSRDLSYLKMMTVRFYEAILANQIVFVDKDTDKDCEILSQIYGDDKYIIDLLYVTPETLIVNYKKIMNDNDMRCYILERQREWYINRLNYLKEKYNENRSNKI